MRAPDRRRRLWLLPIVGAIAGALLALVVGPFPLRLAEQGIGDPVLAGEMREALGDPAGYGTVSVARISDGRTAWAGFPSQGSVDENTRFEPGSIAKTFSGLLLADAVERGEVTLTDPLERHLPELAGTPAGGVTLEELASHRSGLPSLARAPMPQLMLENLAGEVPTVYTDTTTAALIEEAGILELTDRGTMAYSNLGVALIGHALARAAGAADWPAYLTERLFVPIGMTETKIWPPDEPDPGLITPQISGGRSVEPWTGSGYAPAGVSITTTTADLTRYAQAILDGTAPGLSALEARWDTSGPLAPYARIGLTWMSSGPPEEPVVWHSGGTGGMRTFLAVDRSAGEAVIVMNNSTEGVMWPGLRLLGVEDSPPRFFVNLSESDFYVVPALVFVLIFAIGSVRGRNRIGLIARATWAVSGLGLLWLSAPWTWLPGWVFGASVGAVVLGAVAVGLRWARLGWLPRRFAWLGVVMLLLGSALLVMTIALVARALAVSAP